MPRHYFIPDIWAYIQLIKATLSRLQAGKSKREGAIFLIWNSSKGTVKIYEIVIPRKDKKNKMFRTLRPLKIEVGERSQKKKGGRLPRKKMTGKMKKVPFLKWYWPFLNPGGAPSSSLIDSNRPSVGTVSGHVVY